ncbi:MULTISPECIES: ABC transporter ATP-binding protein [Clostridium]|jgi:ATP-binding cassette, subfamily B, multidrug efflux pump|uniref:ABC transporter ATP-binding protein n=1 Tax=Clostridium TaxID=1485 RepID=UPI0018ABE22F|nr:MULTISPECIES: ABC transporter ATP-binding protein [Clostridium]MBU6135450.1 ABC transporter ATP-binding protein/permease [Clostridium tertium]MDB1934926.1 ABC transporter ATP-binding protein [Clostridium tertium]MDB1938842.1 ABC transporter ATP-binding protein [Clostridium tertium]MDB1969118.1 ABC transporter ATP-binding protein [Clostridium tertium]MDU6362952.1 ABC transporter ATP-binding protein [Clostridium sp.]
MKKDKNKEKDTMTFSEDIPQNTKKTIKRLMSQLKTQSKKLIIVGISSLLSSAAYAIIPLIVGSAINNLVKAIRNFDGSVSVLSMVTDALAMPVLMLVLASIFSSFLSYVQQYIISSIGENLTLSLRKEISKKLNRLPLKYFDSHKTGDIMSRVTNDLEKVSLVMQVGFMQFISSCFTIVLTIISMLILNLKLSLLIFIFLGISASATNYVSSLSQRYYAENYAAMGDLSGKIEEVYSGNRIIKVFNKQEDIIEEVTELNKKQFEANRRAQFVDFAIYPTIRFLSQLGFVTTAIVGGIMTLNGQISLGGIQAFLQYVNQVSEPVTQASYVIMSLQSAIAGAERVFELLDEEEEISDNKFNELSFNEHPISMGKVDFKNVKFGYTAEKTLIKDLNLEVKPNEMVAIVGPTGGGKTTLINLIMRFYELNEGTISIDGINIKDIPRNTLRRQIGMVLQDTWLFEGTIAENIAYGRMDATREEIIAAAKAASCDHFIRTLEHGYDTVISSETSNVSQGQMQLLTIARAMLTNPTIMILDEATSSVDTRTEVEIQKALSRLMKDKTSFVIAHRLSTIQNADMILVVKDGDIVERGNHENLLAQNGFYASLYYSQFEVAN